MARTLALTYLQLERRSRAVNGFTEVDGVGVWIDFSTWVSGRSWRMGFRRGLGVQHSRSDGRFEGEVLTLCISQR